MKTRIKVGGKSIELEVKERKGIGKAIGLMFSREEKAKAMLFRFNKETKTAVHSYFCPEFLAIWLKKGKIIDYMLVKKWKISIKPREKFDTLIEIPINNEYKNVINLFKNIFSDAK